MPLLLLLLFALLPVATLSGDESDWMPYLSSLYGNGEEEMTALEEAYEYLLELEQQPLDINRVQEDDLMLMPSLTSDQVKSIISFRRKYGKLESIDELSLIPSISEEQRLFLSHFLTIPSVTTVSPFRNIRHDITATARIPTYYRAGDPGSGSEKYQGKYLGDPISHSLRYSLSFGNLMTVNLAGAKTAGEPFFCNGNSWGYDSYAYNISVKNLGIFNHIIAGTFRARFGLGLILNNGFTLSKQAMSTAVGKNASVFSPHSSTSDSKHLQGIAASATIGGVNVSVFWSYRAIDITLNSDSTIATILTSGYHRTALEMQKKNNATIMSAGTHIAYPFSIKKNVSGNIGASFLYSKTAPPIDPIGNKNGIIPQSKLYRLYAPSGSDHWNVSLDYSLSYKTLTLSGETATGGCKGVATLNTLSWKPLKKLLLTAVQRYYAYQYSSLYSSAFSEGGSVQNESGIYLGAQYKPLKSLTIEFYTDYAYFPWYRYQVSGSSYALDNSLTASYKLKKWTLALRYHIKTRQRDKSDDDGNKALINRTDQRLRLTASLNNKRWTAKTQLEGSLLQFDNSSNGIAISQSLGYKMPRTWSFYVLAAYFNTQDYDSRMYIYEMSMRYSFGYSSYYGNGIRAALLAKADISRVVGITAKAGHTLYFDRNTIGTAERLINSNNQTDIDIQVNIKL